MSTLLLFVLAAYTPANQADVGGPLRLENGLPFAAIFLSTPPLDARIPTRQRFDLRWTEYNVFAYPDHLAASQAGAAQLAAGGPIDLATVAAQAAAEPGSTYYLADLEVTRLDVTWATPIGRRGLFEAHLPILLYGGGFMDGPIDFWHGGFGFGDPARNRFPDGNAQLAWFAGGDGVALTGGTGPMLGDATLRGLWQLRPMGGGWPAVAVSGAVKLPLGAPSKLAGSGTWDAGLGLHATQRMGQSLVYATIGANWHGGWRGLDSVDVRDTVDLHLGYEYRVSREWSWLAQFSLYGSPVNLTEARSLDNPASLYGVAARYNQGERYEWEWGFVENIARSANAHDFGIYARCRLWR